MKLGALKFVLVLGVFILAPFFAFAELTNTDITLSTTPKSPAPGTEVVATLSSYATNLDRAYMSWSVNGKQITSGVGKKSFSFNSGQAGSTTVVSVDIQTISRESFTKRLALASNEVDMLWEAMGSYVPPFYKGKALVSREGSYKVVAIPNTGADSNPNNLSYTWEKDENGQPDKSGWGKNYFTFKNAYLSESNEVLLKVSDVYGELNTESRITLSPTSPKILFYEKDPLFGINLKDSLNNGHLVDKEGETLVAVPYFFSPGKIDSSDLNISWLINGKSGLPSKIKNEIKVRGTEGRSGQAKIRVDVNNLNTLFQTLTKEINVVF